jgi:hypothetical protein
MSRRLTDAEFLDALDDLIVEDILAMPADQILAEIIAEGGDPDAMVRTMDAAFERAVETVKSARSGQPLPDDLLHRGGGARHSACLLVEQRPLHAVAPDPAIQILAQSGLHRGRDVRRVDDLADDREASLAGGHLNAEAAGLTAGRVDIKDVAHAQESEAVPARGQPRANAEKAPAGELPAVASFW